MEHNPAAPMNSQSQSKVLLDTAMPARRRSKMACDTCHYRKIKCNVEKCYPCKNCEKNGVQCTMVGPSMRPPRSISGSSSAAAAAAVAMAMATVANARLSSVLDHRHSSSPRSVNGDDRTKLTTTMEGNRQQLGLWDLLTSNSSPSSQAVDDGSGSLDLPRHRGKLQSYSSSPSLRHIFNAGGAAMRSLASPLPASYRRPDTPPAINKYPSPNVLSGCEPDSEAKSLVNCDYFNLPLSQSAGSVSSVSSVSSPSCTSLARGIAHFSPFDGPRLPPTKPAFSSSLPPTPTQSTFDRSGEHLVPLTPTSPYDIPLNSSRPRSVPSAHRIAEYVIKPMPRRTPSSPYLIAQHQGIDNQPCFAPDRRSSLPWNTHISSPASHPYDAWRHGGHQKGVEMESPTPTQAAFKNQHTAMDPQGFKTQVQPPGSEVVLMRSNSTPAIFGSLSRPHMYFIVNEQDNVSTNDSWPVMEEAGTGADSSIERLMHGIPSSQQFDNADMNDFQYLDTRHQHHEDKRESIKAQQAGSCEWDQDPVSMAHPRPSKDPQPSGTKAENQRPMKLMHAPYHTPNHTPMSQAPGVLLERPMIQKSSVSIPVSKMDHPQGFLKPEPMDDHTFDSSMAMLLDDHLSLMDHLNMIPEAEVFPEGLPMGSLSSSSSSPSALQHQVHGIVPSTTTNIMFSIATTVPSTSASCTKQDELADDPLLYFDTSEPIRPSAGLNQNTTFGYTGEGSFQVKVESGLGPRSSQSNVMQYSLDHQQHPFDLSTAQRLQRRQQ